MKKTHVYEMPYRPEVLIEAAAAAHYECEMCHCDLSGVRDDDVSANFELHSETGLHLQRQGDRYLITSTTAGHKFMKGKTVHKNLFRCGREGRDNDSRVLCKHCHDEIHAIALLETKRRIPGYKGHSATPEILEEVTYFFILRGYF